MGAFSQFEKLSGELNKKRNPGEMEETEENNND